MSDDDTKHAAAAGDAPPASAAPKPIERELLDALVQLQVLQMRAGELTELQRQNLLAELLCTAYLFRAPIFAGRLQLERDVFGRTFLR